MRGLESSSSGSTGDTAPDQQKPLVSANGPVSPEDAAAWAQGFNNAKQAHEANSSRPEGNVSN